MFKKVSVGKDPNDLKLSESYSQPCKTSKMERFAKIGNGC